MRALILISVVSAIALIVGGVWTATADQRRDDSASSPVELGTIHWRRDLDAATLESKRDGRPLLVLFDEVPGCATCVAYGQQVLSHPLLQEAVDTLFIPVAIHNNTLDGVDAQTLKQFAEPACNNPVVRILSTDHTDLVPRVDGDYTMKGILVAMIASLEHSHRDVPAYLRLLAAEASPAQPQKATFAVSCFWSGEAYFGATDGVIATKPGFLHGLEVVDVEFDPAVVGLDKLVNSASHAGYANRVFTANAEQKTGAAESPASPTECTRDQSRPDESPKFYLAQTPLKFVPMTRTQAARINAAVHAKTDWSVYLSPRQIELYHAIENQPDAGWSDATHSSAFISLWRDAMSKLPK